MLLVLYSIFLFELLIYLAFQLLILCRNLICVFVLFFFLKNLLTYQLLLNILISFIFVWSWPVFNHYIKLLIIKAIIIFIMLKHVFYDFFHQQVNIFMLNFHLLKILDLLFSHDSELLLSYYFIFVNVMYIKLLTYLLLWEIIRLSDGTE